MDHNWAHSLVGKDWEIFWDNAADDDTPKPPAAAESPMDYTNVQASNNHGYGSAPNGPPSISQPPDEYSVRLPTTTEGLLIDIAAENGAVVFKNYRRFRDGTMGPSEVYSRVRRSGDIIVAVDGASAIGKGFRDVVAMLWASTSTRLSVSVTFRSADAPNASQVNGANTNLQKTEEVVKKGGPADDKDEADNDHDDISDWYDGKILGYQVTTTGCSFNISFVGEDQIYTMALSPANVRPSAKAWLLRTKALLSSRETENWESSLPVDTSAHQDRAHLEELRKKYAPQKTAFAPQPLGDGSTVPYPTVDHFNRVQTLHFFVKAQIYLRTKLAPVVEIGEKHEDEPTEAYVNYLTICLERLDASCLWYNKCWHLSQHVFATDGVLGMLDVETLRAQCIESGRDEIMSIARTDLSPLGMKRPTPSSASGSRRTKRRRTHRDPSHFAASTKGCSTDEDMDYLSDLDEGQFLSIRAVERFAKKVKHEGKTWFKGNCLEMLRSLVRHIQEPVASWIGEAGRMLGERKMADDDQSSIGTSVEDQDEGEGKEDDESVEMEESAYSYEAVKAILGTIQTHPVLSKFNLVRWTAKLQRKVTLIEEFEQKAWQLIARIADGTNDTENDDDPVLADLTILNNQIYAPDSLLINVAPLAVSPDSKMTKEVIEDAKLIRQWVVDLTQAEQQRERVTFIQDVSARTANLPHIPCVPGEPLGESSLSGKLGKVFARVQHVSAKLFSNVHIVTQYERHLAESSDPKTDTEGLRTLGGIDKALGALALIPVLSFVEEKLSVRRDLFVWMDSAKRLLSETTKESVPFRQVESCYKDLNDILAATSKARNQVTKGLVKSEAIEKQLRQFVRKDVDELSDNVGPKIESFYMRAFSWKERAEAVIAALRFYGNTLAGNQLSSNRAPAMVDCKRMSDLLDEYASLDVSMVELYNVVRAVITETIAWSEKVNSGILQERNLLLFLTTCRNNRPRGVIVDPARHTLDVVVDLLEWHDQVKNKIAMTSVGQNFDELYSLVADGVDVIERYALNWADGKAFKFGRAAVAGFVTVELQNKQAKMPALAKVESTALGKTVLDRLISQQFDEAEGFPMFSLLYIVWAIDVFDFVSAATTDTKSMRPTLVDGLNLAARQPSKTNADERRLLNDQLQYGVAKLAQLVDECKRSEDAAKKIISPSREEFRGSLEKADEVRAYLASLKQVQLTFKSPKQGGKGLVLDAEIEKSVDKLTKELSWFVRTLAIPLLHSDASEVLPTQRISWADLVSLFERIPASGDCLIGDIPRVVLRVRELHESAIMWQDQVSSLLSLSIRGAKKRQVGSQEGDSAAKEGNSKMSNVELDELVKDPILAIVAIPRESAVREVLNKTREFEKMMYDLLVIDYTDSSADKAPYPEASSLVGTKGEFHLYRLTGSSQFSALKASLEKMGLVSSDIAADTPGKEAFEWINQCVEWIESLNSAVTAASPFGATDRLVVPVQEASVILNVGNQLFLDISDDVRRTLSSRRIIVSTNKQSEKLTITVAKGGAHHSTGGTALKWCPLIFEWLKNDIDVHQQWIDRGVEILRNVRDSSAMQGETSQASINRSYQSLEDLRIHLEEGSNSLVVVPEKSFIDKMHDAVRHLDHFVQLATSEPTGKLSLKVAKANRYENPIVAVSERALFLDALLVRRRIQATAKRGASTTSTGGRERTGDGFREKARMKLDKVMKKGMRMMGFRIEGIKDVSLHCTMKAWEIESAAFSKFRDGEKSVKSGYTDKIMSIVNNLDATKNPILCARVITTELTADALLEMTTEQLAGQDVREKKAKATAASNRNIIVASGKSKSPTQKEKTVKNLLSKVSSLANPKLSKPSISSRSATRSQRNDLAENSKEASPASPKVAKPSISARPVALSHSNEHVKEAPLSASSQQQARATRSSMTTSGGFSPPSHEGSSPPDPLSIANALQASQRRIAMLPPVPSLLPSVHHTHQVVAPEVTSSSGTVMSSSNTERFMFTIEKDAFEAKLVLDNDPVDAINRFLPESMTMVGRLKIDEFTSFLKGKMSSGNSTVTALRVSVSDEWKDKYKRFYRDYEKRKKIPMFKIDDKTKLFLVTPRFHAAARQIERQLGSKNHTYAVVIKKNK